MVNKVEELYQQALTLSDEERMKLLRLLTGAPGQGYASPELEAAWQDEIERREGEIADGKNDWLPGAEVMAELSARFGK